MSIVGGSIRSTVKVALTQQMRKTGKIVVCFFGDRLPAEGVSSTGSSHSMASI